jgi:hypothetical protein
MVGGVSKLFRMPFFVVPSLAQYYPGGLYVRAAACDTSCPEGYEAILDKEACIDAAENVAGSMACHSFDGEEQPWEDVFDVVEDADKSRGCYTYGAARHGCGLFVNTVARGSNATCGQAYTTSLLCKTTIPASTATEVVIPTTPTGSATLVPAMDMKSDPEGLYIRMAACDNSSCPDGYEAILDKDTCIDAAENVAGSMACHSFDGEEQPWEDVFDLVEDADKSRGCYTYGAARHGCGLFVNTVARGSNATCGQAYSTSLLCKSKDRFAASGMAGAPAGVTTPTAPAGILTYNCEDGKVQCDGEFFCPAKNNPFSLPADRCARRIADGNSCWGFDVCMPGSQCKYFGNHAQCTPVTLTNVVLV